MITPRTEALIDLALEEDLGQGDVTSRAIFAPSHQSQAFIATGHELVLCGMDVTARIFNRVDKNLVLKALVRDGQRVKKDTTVLEIKGCTLSILAAERTALNFMQRLSGIATQARRFSEAVKSTQVRVVDTRKTTPGFRALEKYAVRCGGCYNHRASLGEHVLIKDNHIAAAGSLAKAVKLCRTTAPHTAKIEVEAKSMQQVRAACEAKADVILLDNMTPEQVRGAVKLIAGRALVEISGGVRFETLADYAQKGVDVISIGALTHSAPAADLSLTILDSGQKSRA